MINSEPLHTTGYILGSPRPSFRVWFKKLVPPDAGAVGLFEYIMII